MKMNSALLLSTIRLLIFLGCTVSLHGCAHNLILTQSEMMPVIPKGAEYRALWGDKEQVFIAEQDRIAIAKGTLMELIKEADKCR